ncbi:hypothetical protein LTR62_006094 [Meristemomyces frigidus]|uniref:Endosomal peripheral membrane protein n=1 Tax=Meristemomyces frigidus TaxID=1508187 RepID=A0AAN7TDJ0_9PEZI|nr:hypothetical protein LTR62_006094 [Meristemomyces frigidus]
MTAVLLAHELTHLIAEAKRKNNDLKTASEKSLHDLKSLPSTSEQQLAADLSRRATFIDPFLIACETANIRYASSGVICLQRLVISKGLPPTRLKETLDAFNACADLGLDVQLKILQALPSLIQNYTSELKDELLAGALQLCASLQSAKAQTISGVAAATLQQLVSAVFEKVVDEDRRGATVPATKELPGDDGPIRLRPAAYDAYRMFRDLVLAAEERPTKFVQLSALSPSSSLELILSALNANARLFVSHPELSTIIGSNLLPAVSRPLSEKTSFGLTIRALRLLDILLARYFTRYLDEFEIVLGLLTHNLDFDPAVPWRRVAAMEVLRNFVNRGNSMIDAYIAYDGSNNGKPVVQDLLSTFVRLSSEKPAAIGLGRQSSVPTRSRETREPGSDQTTFEAATGMAGLIGSALGVAEASVPGISPHWSTPKTACLDQLDKTEAPALPETYVYAMVLECLNSLSDSLARIVLPLTVLHEKADARPSDNETEAGQQARRPVNIARSQSFRQRAIPINPLSVEDGDGIDRVRAVAGLIDKCWPAFLATSSTFLNATLDEQFYRNLIKAYQRFTQVAGLLRLTTPRDALMTTLGRSAVPPHVLNAAMAEEARVSGAGTDSPRVFSNSKALLSVDSLVSHVSTLSTERDRRSSVDSTSPMLSTRNLLCLRALLNLAIALGPTLDSAFNVIVDILRQADMILSSSVSQQLLRRGSIVKGDDSPAAVHAFSAEVAAVESAASRLLESTAEYPNDAFMAVVKAFVRLLGARPAETPSSPRTEYFSPPATPTLNQRNFSGLQGISTLAEMQARDYQFVLPKLGVLSRMNVARFVTYEAKESGWQSIVDELTQIASAPSKPSEARRIATTVLCDVIGECIAIEIDEYDGQQANMQGRALAALLNIVDGVYVEDGELTATDLEVHGHVISAVRMIMDHSGDSLTTGWLSIIATLSTAFERTENQAFETHSDTNMRILWGAISSDLVDAQIGRVAFGTAQLICSDFLAVCPLVFMPSLLELLHRFTLQNEDLNMSLTTVTIILAVAEYLSNEQATRRMGELAADLEDSEDIIADAQTFAKARRPAQLLLLMFQLRATVRDTQKEVRNAAYQTICNILRNRDEQLGPSGWNLLVRNICFGVAADDVLRYTSAGEDTEATQALDKQGDEDISTQILNGIAELMAQHMDVLGQMKRLPSLWEMLLVRLESYLDCESHVLNAAAYAALAKILAQVPVGSGAWTTPVYRTISLWLKRPPEVSDERLEKQDNQAAYTAYMDTVTELHRLAKDSLNAPQTRKLIDNIYHCVQGSNGPKYAGDVNSMSTLQSKAILLLESIDTSHEDLLSSLIVTASEMTLLHHKTAQSPGNTLGPTFIALSTHGMKWLVTLIDRPQAEHLASSALLRAIHALQQIVQSKYIVPAKCKGTYLWQQATTSALKVAKPVLQAADQLDDDAARIALWEAVVEIVVSTVQGHGLNTISDQKSIEEDEQFDIERLEQWKTKLLPGIGRPDLPVGLRTLLVQGLFDASIIHRIEPGEVPETPHSPLSGLYNLRQPRVKRVPFSLRERMSYVCFEELIALATCQEDSPEHVNLAQAAAPLLILRLAIPIRAYITDHPLRGHWPQPLSELEELLFTFEKIKEVRLHPRAFAVDPVAGRRGGSDAHVHLLYPLLVKALAVAGSKWCGSEEVFGPLQAVLEAIMPVA